MDFKEKLELSYRTNRDRWVKQFAGGNVTPEMAEDAIQDAMVKALSNSPDKIQDFDDWLFSVVQGCVVDIVNAEKRGGMVGRSV